MATSAEAQHRSEKNPKLLYTPPELSALASTSTFVVQVSDVAQFQEIVARQFPSIKIVGIYLPTGIIIIQGKSKDILGNIVPLFVVKFIDIHRQSVRPESNLLDVQPAVNSLNRLRFCAPDLNGEGIGISIKDLQFDTTDLDLAGRWVATGREAPAIDQHASDMATAAAGGGNTAPSNRGAAWKSHLASSDFNQLFPDPHDYFEQYGLSVQNHSYGVGLDNQYELVSQAYDQQVTEHPTLIHVFSAGNRGAASDSVGPYRAIAGYANLTGGFKVAKNVLTVGAVDEILTPLPVVSRGPTSDGRLKPEVVAYGAQGSSNAAALVSGVVAVMQQAYQQTHDTLPSAALLRAVLFNSAEDVGPADIDFLSGYGNVNAYRAVQTLLKQSYLTGSVSSDQSVTFSLTVPKEAKNLKLTLAWLDPAATPDSASTLVNDLDITLTHNETGQRWLPWTLSAYPALDSLQAPPRRRVDRLNNQEQISVENPPPGTYTVQVAGYQVPQGPQSFYVAYQWDSANSFHWTYPTGGDALPLTGEPESIVRWETTQQGTGTLDYSLDGGSTWTVMTEQVDLAQSYYRWARPDTLAPAQLRMRISNQTYVSDTFLIHSPLSLRVGFACEDSVLLTWPGQVNADAYTVYQMGNAYLEPMLTTTDTMLVLAADQLTSAHYALAVQHAGFTSPRSSTIDYTQQSLDCYFLGQYVELFEAGVRVTLELGTLHQIAAVVLEKADGSAFYPVQTTARPTTTLVLLEDTATVQGPNVYRSRLVFASGLSLTSLPDTIIAPGTQPFLVYPNPVAAQQYVRILPPPTISEGTLTLLSNQGQPVLKVSLQPGTNELQIPDLPAGIYLYRLIFGARTQTGRIVVY